jgi:hypothetical protein
MRNIYDEKKHNHGSSSLVQEIETGFSRWLRGLRSIQQFTGDPQPEQMGKESSSGWQLHDEERWQDDGGKSNSGERLGLA